MHLLIISLHLSSSASFSFLDTKLYKKEAFVCHKVVIVCYKVELLLTRLRYKFSICNHVVCFPNELIITLFISLHLHSWNANVDTEDEWIVGISGITYPLCVNMCYLIKICYWLHVLQDKHLQLIKIKWERAESKLKCDDFKPMEFTKSVSHMLWWILFSSCSLSHRKSYLKSISISSCVLILIALFKLRFVLQFAIVDDVNIVYNSFKF